MNKTEAIKVLKKDLKIIDDPKVTMTAREWEEHDDHMRDALEMAIAALKQLSLPKIIIRQGEQEPCDKRTIKHTETHACDCISRQDAIEALDQDVMGGLNYRRILRLLPSADRPKGEWIEKEVFDNQDSEVIDCYQSARCSHCGKYHTTPYSYFFDNYNFCPNCGCAMRGEE